MSQDILQISPSSLSFRFELRKLNPATLTLTNPHSVPVAFKVKTTAPKKFCVRPSSGIVDANSRLEVTVIMQAQREMPADLKNCKDKFLIQAVKLEALFQARTPPAGAFDKTKNVVQETKLRVQLEEPPAPPPPVLEDEVADATPQQNRSAPAAPAATFPAAAAATATAPAVDDHGFRNVADDLASVTAERNKYKQSCSELEKKLRDAQEEIMKLSSGPAYDATQAAAATPADKAFKLTIIHVLLATLIAFLLGHFVQF